MYFSSARFYCLKTVLLPLKIAAMLLETATWCRISGPSLNAQDSREVHLLLHLLNTVAVTL